MKMQWMGRIATVGLACVIFGAGCRTKKVGPGTEGGEIGGVTPTDVSTPGGALPQRTPDGSQVTDADAKMENVLFDYNSFQIKDTEIKKLEAVATYLKAHSDVRLVAEGHCDERGSSEYNMALGEHRALAARAYLVGLGVDGTRIQTRSFGKEKPVDPGHGEAAWALNRRVECPFYR